MNKICEDCKVNQVPPYRQKYCDNCAGVRKAAHEASQQSAPPQAPTRQVPATGNEVVPETGTFQSTVWTHAVAANSYEVGQAGNRFKLYFENVSDLKVKIAELKAAGLMEDLEKLPEY